MLDAGSLILGWCAGLLVACAPASRAARSSISVGLCVELLGAVQWGPLVPYRATSWLMLGCLAALAVAPIPRLPPSLPLLPSPVCTVLGGGALGQSLLPDDAIRGQRKLGGTLVPATALTHRTGRESEQPLSTPVTDAAADWWMGGRHREWPSGWGMVDGPAACLSAPRSMPPPPPRAMEPCLVFLRPTAHTAQAGCYQSTNINDIQPTSSCPSHFTTTLPPLDELRHLLDTP